MDTKDTLRSLGLLVLRVGIGGLMLTHGWGKLQMLLAGDFDGFGDPIGLGNTMSLILAVGAEFGASILIMAGAATRFAAVPLVITMGVAAFVVHGGDPWLMGGKGPSKEPALLFLVPFLTLLLTGPGRFSVDAWWRARRAK